MLPQSLLASLTQRGWASGSSTARVGRAPSQRARSASRFSIMLLRNLFVFHLLEGPSGWFQLRPSSEVLLRARAPAACFSNAPSKLPRFSPRGWLAWSPPARVQRGESSTARCASKGDERATLSPTSTPPRSSPRPCRRSYRRIRLVRSPSTVPSGCGYRDAADPDG